ncbi:hypothetical protein LTR84_013141 [Exophiala bonariae]|uniref:Uncharacterized protein n=1 Tax=Exophiala bonariae TaxID=1690606 RepID=A0AAV9NID8_9EURO|nr:hypothetical protein LTR84_013141 [Exophiala bonariae]
MDLDETMTTSTSSTPSAAADAFDDDNLFPDSRASARALTPVNDHLNAAAPGELSPPRSQPRSEESVPQAVPNGAGQQANTSVTRSAAKGAATDSALASETRTDDTAALSAAGALGEREERPGWGWKNKKAQEEMQRTWEIVVDRDFSLKEYGDVVMLGKGT